MEWHKSGGIMGLERNKIRCYKIVKLWIGAMRLYITLIKTVVTTVFNAVKNFSIRVWTSLKTE